MLTSKALDAQSLSIKCITTSWVLTFFFCFSWSSPFRFVRLLLLLLPFGDDCDDDDDDDDDDDGDDGDDDDNYCHGEASRQRHKVLVALI